MTAPDPHYDGLPIEAGDGQREASRPGDPAPDIDALLQRAESEAAELKDAWLRARAETENVRRQGQADVARASRFAIEKFAADLLPVIDALEQSLAAGEVPAATLRAGSELTLKNLQAAFSRANVQPVDPKGERFDPHRHQAMQAVDADLPPNTVVSVLQKGYVLNDRVLRPALVTVAKVPEGH
jgi:molecular chaperone GrpE